MLTKHIKNEKDEHDASSQMDDKNVYSRINKLLTRTESKYVLDNKNEYLYDIFISRLGLDKINLKKIDDASFAKTFQELMDATISGNLFYLNLIKRVLGKINDPRVVEVLINKFGKKINDEILLGLIVIFKKTLNEKRISQDNDNSEKNNAINKTNEQFFNKFLDLYMTMDPTSQALINKILSPRLIKFRQIIARMYIEFDGVMTNEILEKLQPAALSFSETAAKQTDPGCADMTPTGIRRVCQILLALASLIVGETSSSKIKHTVKFDDGETFDVYLTPEAIALAYSIINDVNLDSAIEKSQNDCKKVIDQFKGKTSYLIKNIAPYFFSHHELQKDLVSASFNVSLLMLPVKLFQRELNDSEKTFVTQGILEIKSKLVETIKKDLDKTVKLKSSKLNDIQVVYTSKILQPLQIYMHQLDNSEDQTTIHQMMGGLANHIDELFSNIFYLKNKELAKLIKSKENKEVLERKYVQSILNQVKDIPLPDSIRKEIIDKFQLKFDKLFMERELQWHINKEIKKLSNKNYNECFKKIQEIYYDFTTKAIGEKSRVILKEGSSFYSLMEEFAKVANAYSDIEMLREILKNRKYTNLQNNKIFNTDFAKALYDAAITSKLSDADIKKIRLSLKNQNFSVLCSLSNEELGKKLFEATEKFYSRIYDEDVITIIKSILTRNLQPLKELKNQQIGKLLYDFLKDDIELVNNLKLSAKFEFVAALSNGGLTITPNRLIMWLIKNSLKEKSLPKGQDLPAMVKGLAMQQAFNLESTLQQALRDLFLALPSLGRAFNNTRIRLLSALNNFFHRSSYWTFGLETLKAYLEELLKEDPTSKEKKTIKKIIKKLTINFEKWQTFQISLNNLAQEQDLLRQFNIEWEKDLFKELCKTIIQRYSIGENSFIFLIKFMTTFDHKGSDIGMLKKIATHCDPIIRMGLMDSTTAAIEQIGKPEDSRSNRNDQNTTNLGFKEYVKQLGTTIKVDDYNKEPRSYSDILITSFIGMAFPKVIKRNSDFARFLENLRSNSTRLENENYNQKQEEDFEQIQVNRSPREWNKAIYQRIFKILVSEAETISPQKKLALGLPLAVNARDVENAKDLILEYIATCKRWPIVSELKGIFKNLLSELGVDSNSLIYSLNSGNKERVEKNLRIMGPFDISIIFACQDENLIVKAYKKNDPTMASILLKHCIDQGQPYPVLEAFIQLPDRATHNHFTMELSRAFNFFRLDEAYSTSINYLLQSNLTSDKVLTHLLPLTLESKNNLAQNLAIIKFIELYKNWPFIDKLENLFQIHCFKILDEKTTSLLQATIYDEQLKKVLKNIHPLYLSALTAKGSNPFRKVLEDQNIQAIQILLTHCVTTRQSYPVLDALINYPPHSTKIYRLFEEAILLLNLDTVLKSEQVLDNFFDDNNSSIEKKLEVALTFAKSCRNYFVLHKAVLIFLASYSAVQYADVLMPFFKHLPVDEVFSSTLKNAINTNDFDKVKKIINRVNKIDLSIITACDENPLKIAYFSEDNHKKILTFLLEVCVETKQLLPIADFLKIPHINKDPALSESIPNAMIKLGYKKNESILPDKTLIMNERLSREKHFSDWYSGLISFTGKQLLLFNEYQDEFFQLYKDKLNNLQLNASYSAFIKFSKQLKVCAKNSILASLTLQKMRAFIEMNLNPISVSQELPEEQKLFSKLKFDKLVEILEVFEINVTSPFFNSLQKKASDNKKSFNLIDSESQETINNNLFS